MGMNTNGSKNGRKHAAAVLMLERGFQVRVVGTTPRLVRSELGLRIEPDSCIDEVAGNGGVGLVVLPGQEGCVKRLLADPRVYRFVVVSAGDKSTQNRGLESPSNAI